VEKSSGSTHQNLNIRGNERNGLIINNKLLLLIVKIDSLNKSLIPSKRGWGIPRKSTLLGPTRFCLYLKIFRSKRVMNATLIKIIISETITSIIENTIILQVKKETISWML
jgi:hypothetical protein